MASTQDIYNANGGYTDPNGYGIINQGANMARDATNAGFAQATSAVNNFYNTGMNNLSNAYTQALSTVAPQQQASYSLLDQLLDTLGISRYSSGSGQYSSDYQNIQNQYNSQIQNIQSQMQTTQSNLAKTAQDLANAKNDLSSNAASVRDAAPAAVARLQSDYNNQQNLINNYQQQIQSLTGQQQQAIKGLQSNMTNPQTQQANVLQTLQNQPGYQFNLDQQTKALESQAASAGMLNSGRTLQAVQSNASNYAANTYNNYVNSLLTAAGPSGLGSFTNTAAGALQNQGNLGLSAALNTGNSLSGLATSQGSDLSNIALGQANALSGIYQSALLKNQASSLGNQYASGVASGYSGGQL